MDYSNRYLHSPGMTTNYLIRVLNPLRQIPAASFPSPTRPWDRLRWVARLLRNLFFPATFVALALMKMQSLDRMPVVCVYRILFGVRCPGCGMTHAFCAVLHGHFISAFGYNPLVIIAFPFFSMIVFRDLS